ncbi:transposase [Actinopolymorpha pittospori]
MGFSIGRGQGCPWRDLPAAYSNWKTVYNRHRHWSLDGTWDSAPRAPPGERRPQFGTPAIDRDPHAWAKPISRSAAAIWSWKRLWTQ